MPESIPHIPKAFFNNIGGMSLPEIAYVVANTLFGDDITSDDLNATVKEAFTFDIPVTHVTEHRYALELFHGPTLASKDLGSRFMARLLRFFTARVNGNEATINVIVATSGDVGAAVANGFHHVPGVRVIALYPKGRLTKAQEAQIATLGDNIMAVEVRGDFDDCLRMATDAFFDTELNEKMILTSANSINVASLLPQTIYFFTAYAQLVNAGKKVDHLTFAIPAGNLGHVTSAIIAKRMGVPMDRIIVADNHNDVFYRYVTTGKYEPRNTVSTLASSLDVGNPTNMCRIMELYRNDLSALQTEVTAAMYADDQIAHTMRDVQRTTGRILDPQAAVAYRALSDNLAPGHTGVFLAATHPAKYKDSIENITGARIPVPPQLLTKMTGTMSSIKIPASSSALKKHLLSLT